MKTLSIQQPWASMICAGIKDVENRTWKAAQLQLPAKILIHASSKKVPRNFLDGVTEEMESHICNHVFFGDLPRLDSLPTSAIIGYVTVTGYEEDYTGSVWDGGPDAIKWRLEDACLFDEPIQNVQGKLHLFDYDLDENKLPPAHKVNLRKVALNGDEVVIPTTDEQVEDFQKNEYDTCNVYVTPDTLLGLCKKTDEGYVYEPHSTIKLEGDTISIRYNLKDSGICWIPDPENDTEPMEITFHDDSKGQWQLFQFTLGDKIKD